MSKHKEERRKALRLTGILLILFALLAIAVVSLFLAVSPVEREPFYMMAYLFIFMGICCLGFSSFPVGTG